MARSPAQSPPGPPQNVSDLIEACRDLYAAIDRLDHAAARKVGVTRSDLRALNMLESGPVRAGALATALSLTTGSISALLARLESRGLITRARDPEDRRAVLVTPTPLLFTELGPLYRNVAQAITSTANSYSPQELRAAIRHLQDVTAAYQAAEESTCVVHR